MRKYIIGAVVGAALTLSVSAAADTISMIGKSVQAETDVVLNGKVIDTAIIIDGKSYAPARSISESAGYKVGFEDKKVVLSLTEKKDDPVTTPNTGSVSTPSQVTAMTEVERLENKIARLVMTRHGERVKADPANNFPEDVRAAAEAKIIEIDAEIAELERQKAELE